VQLLDWEQSCWDKEAIISSERVFDHILDMGIWSTWSGCSLNQTPNHSPGASSVSVGAADDLVASAELPALTGVDGGGVNLTCRGERRYDAPRKVTGFLFVYKVAFVCKSRKRLMDPNEQRAPRNYEVNLCIQSSSKTFSVFISLVNLHLLCRSSHTRTVHWRIQEQSLGRTW